MGGSEHPNLQGKLQSAPTSPVGSQHSCQPTVKLHIITLVWIFLWERGSTGAQGAAAGICLAHVKKQLKLNYIYLQGLACFVRDRAYINGKLPVGARGARPSLFVHVERVVCTRLARCLCDLVAELARWAVGARCRQNLS